MTKKIRENYSSRFTKAVKLSLTHLGDFAWLGHYSVLSTVYFLGNSFTLSKFENSPLERGEALNSLLFHAWSSLASNNVPKTQQELLERVEQEQENLGISGPYYAYLLLDLRYFRTYFRPNRPPVNIGDIPAFLNISSARFYVHLNNAVERLANTLLNICRPTAQLERPQPLDLFVGREDRLSAIYNNLSMGKSVSITGVGGIGKTALGRQVRQAWAPENVFWYTVRPRINDNLTSFIFALAHFLFQNGHKILWQQLQSEQEPWKDWEQALSLLRFDLKSITSHQYLLIIDEIDLLHTPVDRPQPARHAQLLTFLESLREEAPMLTLGQQMPIHSDIQVHLDGLSLESAHKCYRNRNVSAAMIERIHSRMEGIPRLMDIAIALAESGDELPELLNPKAKIRSEPLFRRLWLRLSASERQFLSLLAILREPSSLAIFSDATETLALLHSRQLVLLDEQEGISLLPYVQLLVETALPKAACEQLHARAAEVRADEGAYTSAAFHLIEAQCLEDGIKLWHQKMQVEIGRGFAATARHLFERVSSRNLPKRVAALLTVIQNELYLQLGDAEAVVANVLDTDFFVENSVLEQLNTQIADANNILNRPKLALRHYEAVQEQIEEQTAKLMQLHLKIAQIELREQEWSLVVQRTHRIEYASNLYYGYVNHVQAKYENALTHFIQAKEAAIKLNDKEYLANINIWLSRTYAQLPRPEQAKKHLADARQYYQKIGNKIGEARLDASLAGYHLNTGEYEKAIEPALNALTLFEQVQDVNRIAATCTNLAEAFFATGNSEKALRYAQKALHTEDASSFPYAQYTIGLVHQKQGRFEKAASAFEAGIDVAQSKRDTYIEAFLIRCAGTLQSTQGHVKGATDNLQRALQLFQEMGIEHEAQRTMELIDAL